MTLQRPLRMKSQNLLLREWTKQGSLCAVLRCVAEKGFLKLNHSIMTATKTLSSFPVLPMSEAAVGKHVINLDFMGKKSQTEVVEEQAVASSEV